MISFIQRSGIVTAMVGLLNAPKGTKLYQRLMHENRLTKQFSGNNTDMSINFVPKMDYENLITGYKHILTTIYSPKEYHDRIYTFLQEYQPEIKSKVNFTFEQFRALIRSVWVLGIRHKGSNHYWKLLFWTLFRHPRFFALSVTLAICGFHFRQVVQDVISSPT
jgi:hypothetical protein